MDARVDSAFSDDPTGAIPVSPVKFDIAALTPPPVGPFERVRYAAILVLCLGLHAALLFWLEDRPQASMVEEAIPVEVIIEPAPEDAPAPEPEKPQEPEKAEEKPEEKAETPVQRLDEPPATDFARAADQDREDGKASEQAATPASEPEAQPPEQTEKAELPPPQPEPVPEAIPEPPPPPPLPPTKPPARFAGLTPLPEFEFKAPLAKRTDGPKGQAQPGYLSTLYGQIMRKMPALPKPARPARGRVTFGVMGNGRIFQETIAIPSGAPFLDAAALGAVRRAAPYPPPPNGAPVFIRFDYGSD